MYIGFKDPETMGFQGPIQTVTDCSFYLTNHENDNKHESRGTWSMLGVTWSVVLITWTNCSKLIGALDRVFVVQHSTGNSYTNNYLTQYII